MMLMSNTLLLAELQARPLDIGTQARKRAEREIIRRLSGKQSIVAWTWAAITIATFFVLASRNNERRLRCNLEPDSI